MADIIIRNATLLSPKTQSEEIVDVAIRDGIVTDIAQGLEASSGSIVLDGAGKYMTTGWIDAHAHLYNRSGTIGLDRDSFLPQGVTYVIEAGTTGPENFEDYLLHCGRKGHIHGRAYLNLAPQGVVKDGGELTDLSKVDLEACEKTIAKYPEEIIGVKLRIDPRVCENPWKAMELIAELSRRTGKPLIVHASRTEMPMEDILSHMKAGDIFAHSFADKAPGLLDERGCVKEAVLKARERGVYFDLSHGKSNFSFAVSKAAIDQGFLPDAISTDLHAGSLSIVGSLALTMSKMMACGLNLHQVTDLVTVDAARMLGISEKATEIAIGQKADMTLFKLENGEFTLTDSDGKTAIGHHLISPYCTVLGERVYYAE